MPVVRKPVSGYLAQVGYRHLVSTEHMHTSMTVLCVCVQKCGYELQESKMLSLSTRQHDYGRQSRDDAQGYYAQFRQGGYEADASDPKAGGSGYGVAAQSGLGMFDRMNLGDDISEGDEEEESTDDEDSSEEEA